MMNERPFRRIGRSHGIMAVGAPSIVMIFVVLCLTSFAALSMASANADMRLVERTAANTAAWYRADAEAQRRLQALDLALAAGMEPADTAEACEMQLESGADGDAIAFLSPVTDSTAISVRVRLIEGERRYAIVDYRTVVTAQLDYGGMPAIYTGE